MNINQLLIRLNKVAVESRGKDLKILVGGKELDFAVSQMIDRQDAYVLDISKVEAPIVQAEAVEEPKKEVKKEVPVIKATDLKADAPTAAKKPRKKTTPKK